MTTANSSITRSSVEISEKLRIYGDRLWYYRSYAGQAEAPAADLEAVRRRIEGEQPDLMDGLDGYLDLDYGYAAGVISALRWLTGSDWRPRGP